MNKDQFVELLNKKLFYLVDNEREKEVNKYISAIDNYVNMGQDEAFVINNFGNIDDLVTAIYLSHGLDYKKLFDKSYDDSNYDKGAFKNFISLLTSKNNKASRNAIFYVVYIFLLVILLKVFFIFVRDIGSQIFADMFKNKSFDKYYTLGFEIAYYLVAIMVFVFMFKKKFGNKKQ